MFWLSTTGAPAAVVSLFMNSSYRTSILEIRIRFIKTQVWERCGRNQILQKDRENRGF
jgi:hypothetical protein